MSVGFIVEVGMKWVSEFVTGYPNEQLSCFLGALS
jgi:hypothetical protein